GVRLPAKRSPDVDCMVGLDAARIIGQSRPFVKEDARMIEFFNPPDAPAPGAFSRAPRAAGLVLVPGPGGGNDPGGAAPTGTAAEQTRKALDNVAAILRAAGSSVERVVQMTLLITDPADYREINAE